MFGQKRTFDLLVVPTYRIKNQDILDKLVLKIIRSRPRKPVAVRSITNDTIATSKVNACQLAGQFTAIAHTWPLGVLVTKERLLEAMTTDVWDTYQNENFWIFVGNESNVVTKLLAFADAQPQPRTLCYRLQIEASGRQVICCKLT